MKKIAFITDKVYPYFVGGQEKRIFEYSSILNDSDDFAVSVVSMRWWKNNEDFVKDIEYVDICPQLEIYKKDSKRNTISSIRFGIATFFHVLKCDDDILDVDVFPYFPLFFARLAIFFKRKKPIISGYWVEYLGKEYWKDYLGMLWWIGVLFEKMSFVSCDIIATDSNFTKKRLQQVFGKKKRVVVMSPVSLDVEKINNIVVQEKKYDIIYFGRIIAHKHVEHVVDIVHKFAEQDIDIKALIIGSGPDAKKIEQLIDAKKISQNIDRIDFVEEYAELIKKIKSARVMIQPSEREGFGITVVEANACGLPVFVVDYPDNAAKELIEDGVNGFVCENPENLVQSVQSFFQNDKFDTNLKEISQKSIQMSQEYSTCVMRKKVIKYYSNL